MGKVRSSVLDSLAGLGDAAAVGETGAIGDPAGVAAGFFSAAFFGLTDTVKGAVAR